jgi:hypothetical protein
MRVWAFMLAGMDYQPPPPPAYYDRRISVSVPADFDRAVREAAKRAGLSLADFCRIALGKEAVRTGVTAPPLPARSISRFFDETVVAA